MAVGEAGARGLWGVKEEEGDRKGRSIGRHKWRPYSPILTHPILLHSRLSQLPIPPDQRIGRAIVL